MGNILKSAFYKAALVTACFALHGEYSGMANSGLAIVNRELFSTIDGEAYARGRDELATRQLKEYFKRTKAGSVQKTARA